MHSQPNPGGSPTASSSHADDPDVLEFMVVSHLVGLHPVLLTTAEAVRELVHEPRSDVDAVRVRDAIHDTVRTGLLRMHGELVVPTRSTLRLVELWTHA